MGAYIPPGWPAGVHPPGSEDFESTAVGWLLDVVPPDYRLHGVLRRYPVALATMARYHSKACVEGARQGYRTARTELAGALPPHAIDTVLAAYRKEGARLAATARAVDLVERALRGEVFTPRMSLPQTAPGPQSAGPESTGPESTGPESAEPESPGPESAEPKSVQPVRAGPRGAGPEAADKRPARTKAEQKAAAQRTAKAKATEQEAGGAKATRQEAGGAKTGAAEPGRAGPAERGRAGARRNSSGRGRSDLART
jgi:outer membrane biosynthesis protein TonB